MEKSQGRSVITSVGGLNDRQLLARSIGPANGGLASGKGRHAAYIDSDSSN